MTAPAFRPLPAAMIDRMVRHARAIGQAVSTDDALASLFLLHCECKDAEAALSGDLDKPDAEGATLRERVLKEGDEV